MWHLDIFLAKNLKSDIPQVVHLLLVQYCCSGNLPQTEIRIIDVWRHTQRVICWVNK